MGIASFFEGRNIAALNCLKVGAFYLIQGKHFKELSEYLGFTLNAPPIHLSAASQIKQFM